MLSAALIVACAFLNRFRGGGFYADRLPGHPRFYVAPVMGLVAWMAGHDPLWSTLFAAAWLFWCFLPWGLLMSLGRWEPQREIDRFEDELLLTAGDNIWVAFWLRHLIGFLPMAVLCWWSIVVLPPLFVAAYEASWRWSPRAQVIAFPEMAVGTLFGLMLVWSAS